MSDPWCPHDYHHDRQEDASDISTTSQTTNRTRIERMRNRLMDAVLGLYGSSLKYANAQWARVEKQLSNIKRQCHDWALLSPMCNVKQTRGGTLRKANNDDNMTKVTTGDKKCRAVTWHHLYMIEHDLLCLLQQYKHRLDKMDIMLANKY